MTNYNTTSYSSGRKNTVAEAAAALVAKMDTLDSTTHVVRNIKINREGATYTGTLI